MQGLTRDATADDADACAEIYGHYGSGSSGSGCCDGSASSSAAGTDVAILQKDLAPPTSNPVEPQ